MSLKRSEDFIYFQNKASHYHNITMIKSKLDTKVPSCLSNTIDYHGIKPQFKHEPHLREFDIQFQNKNMMKRIKSNQRSPINRYDSYSRFNDFERSFRRINPQQREEQRLIELENQKFKKSIEKAKSLIGSVHEWKINHDQNIKRSRLIRKFGTLKANDILSSEKQKRHLEKYINLIFSSQLQNSTEDLTISSRSKAQAKSQVEKQIVLPQLISPRIVQNQNDSKAQKPQKKDPIRQNEQKLQENS